jgi:hypothetical protein
VTKTQHFVESMHVVECADLAAGAKVKNVTSNAKVKQPAAPVTAGKSRPIARGGVFPVGSAVKSRNAQDNEYYSYEYSDDPLANDNNNSAGKRYKHFNDLGIC